MKNNRVVFIYGVSSVGKSHLAHELSSRFQYCDTIATDHLLEILRSIDKSDLCIHQSIYSHQRSINVIDWFKTYRDKLQPFIKIMLEWAYSRKVDIILEGVHIYPKVFLEYSNILYIKPFLITISNKDIHSSRIKEKFKDRPDLLKTITSNFKMVRHIQDFLTKEAEKYNIPIIDNSGRKEKTLDTIMEHLK